MSESRASSEGPAGPADAPSEKAGTPSEQAGTPVGTPVEKSGTPAGEDGVITDIPVLHTAKRLKVEARKLDGMQRELYSLMGDHAPPVVVTTDSKFKTRPEWQQRATPWKLAEFAPKPGLNLRHWVRASSLVEGTSGHRFARFDTPTDVPEWTDDQYSLFTNPAWSLEETRYLFALAKEYDLRWLVIADRYDFKGNKDADSEDSEQNDEMENEEQDKDEKNKDEKDEDEKDEEKNDEGKDGKNGEENDAKDGEDKEKEGKAEEKSAEERAKEQKRWAASRSVEALKDRYYEVCRALIKHKPVTPELGLSPRDDELLAAMAFDRGAEETRKAHLERLLSRSPKEVAEEEALVLEARKLVALSDKMLAERQELLRVLDSPANLSGTNALKLDLSSSHGVGQLLQDLNNDKAKRALLSNGGPAAKEKPEQPGVVAPAARRTVAKIVASTLDRQLTPREEAMLGIAYALPGQIKSSGVYLRSTRLTPVRQSLLPKVRTITAELGLPLRPVMPTAQVCAAYETLYQTTTLLLEAKKVQDKLEMEVDILRKAKET